MPDHTEPETAEHEPRGQHEAPEPTVTERTPIYEAVEAAEGVEASKVVVPQPAEGVEGEFVKHYVVSGEGETDCTNDMIDSALQVGLRPTGNAHRVGAEDHPGGTARIITWSIPVREPQDRNVTEARDETEKAEG